MLKAIHGQEDRKAAKAKAAEVVQRLKEMRLKSAAELVAQKVEETLTYYGYPAVHWRQIRTTDEIDKPRCCGQLVEGMRAPGLGPRRFHPSTNRAYARSACSSMARSFSRTSRKLYSAAGPRCPFLAGAPA